MAHPNLRNIIQAISISEGKFKEPAEDSDGEGVCDDTDDGHDEGGVPAQVQVDLTEQVQLLPCWFLRHRCLVTSQNILPLMDQRW